uniref:Putative DNA-directed RNA polymerase subunit omega n=1 Tax=Corynoplastis japonica TaxID=700918 RepID=A0A1X9PU25_9RHOD|nr:conserved hypothetical plastid protein [Corynoplastis japonica]
MSSFPYLDTNQILYKTEELLETADNRYQITLKVANRAKRKKYENIDIVEDPKVKPVIRSIIEIVEDINQPEFIID